MLVCLRIIIELHRQFRPPMQSEIQHFLHFVKNIYKELPNNIVSIYGLSYFDTIKSLIWHLSLTQTFLTDTY